MYFLSLEAVVCIFLSQEAVTFFLKAVTCMCALGSLRHFYVSLDTGCMCVESWLAIKDLQPTAPVLKAGHPLSCSSLCMLCVVCLGCIVWFVDPRRMCRNSSPYD